MASIQVATSSTIGSAQQQQQQQQQVRGAPGPIYTASFPASGERNQLCPISSILTTDVDPVQLMPMWCLTDAVRPAVRPADAPVVAPAPAAASQVQAPSIPEVALPGPSSTNAPPASPRKIKNAAGRTLLPNARPKIHAQSSRTPLNGAQSLTSALNRPAASASASAPAPASVAALAPAADQVPAQPAVEASNQGGKQKEKVRCRCTFCVRKRGPEGKMMADKTFKEHKRADDVDRTGTAQDPKCGKCHAGGYRCVRRTNGPCSVCMRMSDKCSFTGISLRQREVNKRTRNAAAATANASVVGPSPATQQAPQQQQESESSSEDETYDDELPDLFVPGQQGEEFGVDRENENAGGESNSVSSGTLEAGSNTPDAQPPCPSPPPAVEKRPGEVEEDGGEFPESRPKRLRTEAVPAANDTTD
ncbi:hypothetical protein BDP55DRAFT_150040 [Colletotrichum godetiae]|uniref:Zn(2)-C6 fungal-type domain-containing protein n=1 Tax=Colletotrichum godetiae TaxID=1209918 RepID=A0AAJ0AM64_9PEZI|nr:uncharacterized protein BDP55DRAFT_150040 [Colletotrichum godetiae]KAK1675785.1 hypothetical protein BDP55DRAFT_150040 [Colletotrichum godetiae]